MTHYTQLTQAQRYQISIMMEAHHNQTEIANLLSVHKSMISRELRRNRGLSSYRPQQAHRFCLQRRTEKVEPRIASSTWSLDELLLRQDWSPDQISIEQRPAIVEARRRFGNWKLDTLIGKNHRQALVTLVERKSCLTLIAKVIRKTTDDVSHSIEQLLTPPASWVHTLTADNGRKFALHVHIAKTLNAKFYFAHPYASEERGLNENTKVQIRQYFPRNTTLRPSRKNKL